MVKCFQLSKSDNTNPNLTTRRQAMEAAMVAIQKRSEARKGRKCQSGEEGGNNDDDDVGGGSKRRKESGNLIQITQFSSSGYLLLFNLH